jgi:hypothetical protein
MAKILLDNRWFEEVAPTGTYESVYEALIKAHAVQLWPRFHAVNFKATVYANGEGVKPDLVLIEKDYSEWWVVEVEMAHHALESHVYPQAKKLTDAFYGDDEAERIATTCSALDINKVKQMLKDLPPRVLVIVHKPKPDWARRLSTINALVAVFEVFRSDENKYLFRVNGEHPIGATEKISHCKIDQLVNRWLLLSDPIGLRVRANEDIQIEYDGLTTVWRRFDITDKVWLHTPFGPNPLSDRFEYHLVRLGDGRFAFLRIESIS